MGVGEWEVRDSGTETGNAQVGGGPREEAVDSGTETDNAQVSVGSRVGTGTGMGVMAVL